MAAPLITAITTVPNRGNATNQASFSNDVDTFFSEVNGFQTEANAQAQYLDGVAAQVDASEAAAAASSLESAGYAGTAIDARDAAISSSVYKGTWEGKTGAGVIGESYSYQGSYIYRLNVNLANLSTSVPSPTNTDWQLINVVPFEAPCKATLDLDFANQDFTIYDKLGGFVKRPLADIVSQGRATAGTSTDAIGGVTEFAAGENRFEFDPVTGEALGYLSEESRTRLNTIYITPTANENITTTAQSYTISMWGAGTITLSGTYSGTLVGVDEFTRVTLTFTAAAGALTLAYSGACLNVQLEAGAFATSLVLGAEGTAITRDTDSITRTLGQEWNSNEGTFVVDVDIFRIPNTGAGLISFEGSFASWLFIGSTTNQIRMFDGLSTSNAGFDLGSTNSLRIAASSTKNLMSFAVNGVFIDQSPTSGGLLSQSAFTIPSGNISKFKEVIYYPRAFDALTLQRLSRIQ
jgi:hypothetical protein